MELRTAAPQPSVATFWATIVEPSATNDTRWTDAPDTLTVYLGDHLVWTNIASWPTRCRPTVERSK